MLLKIHEQIPTLQYELQEVIKNGNLMNLKTEIGVKTFLKWLMKCPKVHEQSINNGNSHGGPYD